MLFMNKKNILILFVFSFLLSVSFVSAAGFTATSSSARLVNTQSYPTLNGLYSGSDVNTYWPIVGDRTTCQSRQDILLQIAPAGCQPTVVRSDLLGDQSVAVLCQLQAFQVNPLLDIKAIDSITFSGSYPAEVSTVGYYPAQAALSFSSRGVENNALLNNAGYVVVVLKRQQNESALPESVNLNLTARLRYDSYNALGIGQASFILDEQTEEQFKESSFKNSFWQGRYYIKADSIDSDSAMVSLYYQDRKITSLRVERGKASSDVYIPGFSTCQASLNILYDGYSSSTSNRAKIEVQEGDKKTDVFDVYSGMSFANGKCRVSGSINVNDDGSGDLGIVCSGSRTSLAISSGEAIVDESSLTDEKIKSTLNYVRKAISEYKTVARDYSSETDGETNLGEKAIQDSIKLIRNSGQGPYLRAECEELISLYKEKYSSSNEIAYYENMCESSITVDRKDASAVFNIDNEYITVRVLSFTKSNAESKANLKIGDSSAVYSAGSRITFTGNSGTATVSKITPDYVEISHLCSGSSSQTAQISEGSSTTICNQRVSVNSIDAEKLGIFRIVPRVDNTQTQTNLSVSIGIEKRAIQLSPERATQTIRNLNDSINKFESITKTLNTATTGLKTACFATAAFLTAKNFVTGIDGESTARKSVMQGSDGWTARCESAFKRPELISQYGMEGGPYASVDDCFRINANKINSDVEVAKNADSTRDATLSTNTVKQSAIEGSSTDIDATKEKYSSSLKSKYSSSNSIGSLVKDDSLISQASLENLKELEYNSLIADSSTASSVQKTAANKRIAEIKTSLETANSQKVAEDKVKNSLGGLYSFSSSSSNVYRSQDSVSAVYSGNTYSTSKSIGGVDSSENGLPIEQVNYQGQIYLVTLSDVGGSPKQYVIKSAYSYDPDTRQSQKVNDVVLRDLKTKFSSFTQYSEADFNNKATDLKVKYYDSGTAKGRPSVVPVDPNAGWYAGIQEYLPSNTQQSSYQSSGQVSSFYLCNVYKDGREDFSSFLGGAGVDDKCTMINLYTGQAPAAFGLSSSKVQSLIDKAQQAIRQASQQYSSGVKSVKIDGQNYGVENAISLPGIRCQDYMSPQECLALYNVCDPVICPSSRCNFGGTYYVSDVAASGIAGSALLCLPNAQEGVLLPVCLSGLAAGLDGYVSILKSHRDCLQEQLETGSTVGVCDQIYSVYMCEFFWRQVVPLTENYLPKITSALYGGSSGSGGGEYTNIVEAWRNTQESVNFFTQTYAVNSLKAFQVKSVADVGTEFCKAFASVKAPTSFDSLVEPDSPPQFHAWFSEIKYSDATVPATSQYKVYYHVFAGQDTGVSFQVYLKNPSTVSVVSVPQTLIVDSGFVTRGNYASETKDFTAPEGYKELCVNVNGNEECGFGQVSTSFALDYLTDKSRANTINQTGITSSASCVSGSVGTGVTISPNIQATAESAIDPKIYNQGIIRICASDNPGSTTSPGRYVDVGYCDNSNIRCWLDTESTGRAISEGNEGTKEDLTQSLSELEEANNQAQVSVSGVLSDEGFDGVYDELKKNLDSFLTGKTNTQDIDSASQNEVSKISQAIASSTKNSQVAKLIILQGNVYAKALEAISQLSFVQKGDAPTNVNAGSSSNVQATQGEYNIQLKDTGSTYTSPEGKVSQRVALISLVSSEGKSVDLGNDLYVGRNVDDPSKAPRWYVYDLTSSVQLRVVGHVLDGANTFFIDPNSDIQVGSDLYNSVNGKSFNIQELPSSLSSLQDLTLEGAIRSIQNSEGKYSDNKDKIDRMYQDYLISKEGYDEIIGKGLTKFQKDMVYVRDLLLDKWIVSQGSSQIVLSLVAPVVYPNWISNDFDKSSINQLTLNGLYSNLFVALNEESTGSGFYPLYHSTFSSGYSSPVGRITSSNEHKIYLNDRGNKNIRDSIIEAINGKDYFSDTSLIFNKIEGASSDSTEQVEASDSDTLQNSEAITSIDDALKRINLLEGAFSLTENQEFLTKLRESFDNGNLHHLSGEYGECKSIATDTYPYYSGLKIRFFEYSPDNPFGNVKYYDVKDLFNFLTIVKLCSLPAGGENHFELREISSPRTNYLFSESGISNPNQYPDHFIKQYLNTDSPVPVRQLYSSDVPLNIYVFPIKKDSELLYNRYWSKDWTSTHIIQFYVTSSFNSFDFELRNLEDSSYYVLDQDSIISPDLLPSRKYGAISSADLLIYLQAYKGKIVIKKSDFDFDF